MAYKYTREEWEAIKRSQNEEYTAMLIAAAEDRDNENFYREEEAERARASTKIIRGPDRRREAA